MNDDDVMGVFMGLESSSHEYVAWLIAPYKPDFAVEIGSLLLIQNVRDHIVARVMDYAPRGEFVSAMGEKWLNDIASDGALDAVGLDIKRSKVSYKVRIKVLGSLSEDGFLPGLRRIPQITSKVRLPNKITLEKIIGAAMKEQSAGVHIGYYDMDPSIQITFDQKELNSKRTFIFARAGYGKSNLMKVICSEWKKENGGLLVFDQEGEYAITDRKGRPGIMDRRSALLITNQKMPPGIKNIYPNTGLNLTELPPGLAVPILVNPDKHGTIFFAKLMSMGRESWPLLVELLRKDGWDADYNDVGRIVQGTRFGDNISKIPSEVDIKPILNNLVPGIRTIHDPDSKMISIIGKALRQGQVVIFDISRTDAHTARLVSSIIIKNIFEDNKNNFIRYGGDSLIKATFVLEEAHTVLSDSGHSSAPSAFVDLAKEGRKYNLGGIFITQQPGSIPAEIVSQGDNFFVFHLLSKVDLSSLSRANAHYSDDIITQILSEPVRGKSYMWTSHQPFVIPIRVVNFEDPKLTQAHQSKHVQEKDDILGGITGQIDSEANNPHIKSIYQKFLQMEEENPGKETRDKTIPLLRKLTSDEKKYLEDRHHLQPDKFGREPFAVTISFYQDLLSRRARQDP